MRYVGAVGICCVSPGLNVPLLVVGGAKGAGKSTPGICWLQRVSRGGESSLDAANALGCSACLLTHFFILLSRLVRFIESCPDPFVPK